MSHCLSLGRKRWRGRLIGWISGAGGRAWAASAKPVYQRIAGSGINTRRSRRDEFHGAIGGFCVRNGAPKCAAMNSKTIATAAIPLCGMGATDSKPKWETRSASKRSRIAKYIAGESVGRIRGTSRLKPAGFSISSAIRVRNPLLGLPGKLSLASPMSALLHSFCTLPKPRVRVDFERLQRGLWSGNSR